MIKTINEKLVLEQYQPGKIKTTLFESSIEINKWHNHAIGIYVSDGLNSGYIEYWFNREKQEMPRNSSKFKCRTFDGSYVDSKWRIYGAFDYDYNSYVKNIKIGTTYNDVK